MASISDLAVTMAELEVERLQTALSTVKDSIREANDRLSELRAEGRETQRALEAALGELRTARSAAERPAEPPTDGAIWSFVVNPNDRLGLVAVRDGARWRLSGCAGTFSWEELWESVEDLGLIVENGPA